MAGEQETPEGWCWCPHPSSPTACVCPQHHTAPTAPAPRTGAAHEAECGPGLPVLLHAEPLCQQMDDFCIQDIDKTSNSISFQQKGREPYSPGAARKVKPECI